MKAQSLWISEAHGKLGGSVFRHTRHGMVISSKRSPTVRSAGDSNNFTGFADSTPLAPYKQLYSSFVRDYKFLSDADYAYLDARLRGRFTRLQLYVYLRYSAYLIKDWNWNNFSAEFQNKPKSYTNDFATGAQFGNVRVGREPDINYWQFTGFFGNGAGFATGKSYPLMWIGYAQVYYVSSGGGQWLWDTTNLGDMWPVFGDDGVPLHGRGWFINVLTGERIAIFAPVWVLNI